MQAIYERYLLNYVFILGTFRSYSTIITIYSVIVAVCFCINYGSLCSIGTRLKYNNKNNSGIGIVIYVAGCLIRGRRRLGREEHIGRENLIRFLGRMNKIFLVIAPDGARNHDVPHTQTRF